MMRTRGALPFDLWAEGSAKAISRTFREMREQRSN
jgi:hypothetical protein